MQRKIEEKIARKREEIAERHGNMNQWTHIRNREEIQQEILRKRQEKIDRIHNNNERLKQKKERRQKRKEEREELRRKHQAKLMQYTDYKTEL